MAVGRSITGALDMTYWKNQLNNASSQSAATKVVQDMMDAANWLGISNNDQKNVLTIIEAYEKKYNVDLSSTKKIWDPSQNHINSLEYGSSNYKQLFADNVNSVQHSGESQAWGSSSNSTAQWVAATGNAALSAGTPRSSTTSSSTSSSTTSKAPTSSGGGSSAPVSTYTPTYDDSALREQLAKQDKQIEDLMNQLYELQRPRTNQELADHYGLGNEYSEAYWKGIYDDMTNDYFSNAIKEQSRIREQSAVDQNMYTLDLMDEYNKANQNSVGTSLTKGMSGSMLEQANQLMSGQNSDNDYNLLKSINQLGEDWKAELANNDLLAKQAYTDLGVYLQQLGVNHNRSDVTDYYNTLKRYVNDYTTTRASSAARASAAAGTYAGLANAAGTRASSTASNYNDTLYQQLFDVINSIYGSTGMSNTAYTGITGQRR